jgi:glyceraldehyde 3-phosphate dehydrogenase
MFDRTLIFVNNQFLQHIFKTLTPMSKIKIGLNGFGRIGRALTRIAFDHPDYEIVAINTRSNNTKMMAYLLQYDSLYRTWNRNITHNDNAIFIDDREIICTGHMAPHLIPWKDLGVDIVVDATGAFTISQDLNGHLEQGAKKVILTCPAKDESIPDIVLGVNATLNEEDLILNASILSNASCTTNCVAPMLKVLDDAFGVHSAFLTTVHAYTATQSLLDEFNKEPNRSRAAALNIIPTTTGASKAVGKVMPQLKGRIDGMALRVPVPTVSFTDLTVTIKKETSVAEINELFHAASQNHMKGILQFATAELVSSDYIGNPHSCIFDSNYTKVFGLDNDNIRVYGWYDNEWGYANRVSDLVAKCARKISSQA